MLAQEQCCQSWKTLVSEGGNRPTSAVCLFQRDVFVCVLKQQLQLVHEMIKGSCEHDTSVENIRYHLSGTSSPLVTTARLFLLLHGHVPAWLLIWLGMSERCHLKRCSPPSPSDVILQVLLLFLTNADSATPCLYVCHCWKKNSRVILRKLNCWNIFTWHVQTLAPSEHKWENMSNVEKKDKVVLFWFLSAKGLGQSAL